MPKRNIEIDDDLEETVDTVKEEIRDNFIQYLRDNPLFDKVSKTDEAGKLIPRPQKGVK